MWLNWNLTCVIYVRCRWVNTVFMPIDLCVTKLGALVFLFQRGNGGYFNIFNNLEVNYILLTKEVLVLCLPFLCNFYFIGSSLKLISLLVQLIQCSVIKYYSFDFVVGCFQKSNGCSHDWKYKNEIIWQVTTLNQWCYNNNWHLTKIIKQDRQFHNIEDINTTLIYLSDGHFYIFIKKKMFLIINHTLEGYMRIVIKTLYLGDHYFCINWRILSLHPIV